MDAKQMFPLTSELKEAMGRYAQSHNTSVAELIRQCVAREIGFDLEPVETHRKYASEAERVAAQKERNAATKQLKDKLYKEYMAKHTK